MDDAETYNKTRFYAEVAFAAHGDAVKAMRRQEVNPYSKSFPNHAKAMGLLSGTAETTGQCGGQGRTWEGWLDPESGLFVAKGKKIASLANPLRSVPEYTLIGPVAKAMACQGTALQVLEILRYTREQGVRWDLPPSEILELQAEFIAIIEGGRIRANERLQAVCSRAEKAYFAKNPKEV